jgi:CheY-like chemotaxis protein
MNMDSQGPEKYEVSCNTCKARFDALDSVWCNCLVVERSLVCPSCLNCFCRATTSYKERFWASAPQELWDRKLEEHRRDWDKPNPNPEAVKRPLVLVVDDEKEIQRVAIRDIEGLGYGVILAHDGIEGFELAKKYKPELILSDALMPKMDGREMCRRIKADPETSKIKVVIMTSLYTQSKFKTEAYREFRVDDYLSKPLDFNQLRTVLQKHLG